MSGKRKLILSQNPLLDLLKQLKVGLIRVRVSKPVNLEKDFEYILSCSKLLPSYGYPVGLDIVDKSAKIPSWLGRAADHIPSFI